MSSLLAAVATVLLLAAAREAWGEWGEAAGAGARRLLRRRLGAAAPAGPRLEASARRLRRAGLAGRLDPRLLLAARAGCALASVPLALSAAPIAPGGLPTLVAFGLPLAAAAIPDLYLERRGRRRRERILDAMPAALELMAVGAASGRGARSLVADAAEAAPGPLGEELSAVVAELQCGQPQARALARLGREAGGELAAIAVLLERSRRLGSPLAVGLQERAATLRSERARRTRERAARAAPKIQLIVALLLVPSVLLIVAAAIIANAEALLIGL